MKEKTRHPSSRRRRGALAPPTNLATQLGIAIRRRREHLGLSQRELAFRCDTDVAWVGQIERGEVACRLPMFERLTRGLDWTPIELFRDAGTGNAEAALTMLSSGIRRIHEQARKLAEWVEALKNLRAYDLNGMLLGPTPDDEDDNNA